MNFNKKSDKQEEVHVKAELAGWWLVLWDDKVVEVEVLVLGHSHPRGGLSALPHITPLFSQKQAGASHRHAGVPDV